MTKTLQTYWYAAGSLVKYLVAKPSNAKQPPTSPGTSSFVMSDKLTNICQTSGPYGHASQVLAFPTRSYVKASYGAFGCGVRMKPSPSPPAGISPSVHAVVYLRAPVSATYTLCPPGTLTSCEIQGLVWIAATMLSFKTYHIASPILVDFHHGGVAQGATSGRGDVGGTEIRCGLTNPEVEAIGVQCSIVNRTSGICG